MDDDRYLEGGDYNLEDYRTAKDALVKSGPFADGPFAREVSYLAAMMVGDEGVETVTDALFKLAGDLKNAAVAVTFENAIRSGKCAGKI